jgi:hypothetical protein
MEVSSLEKPPLVHSISYACPEKELNSIMLALFNYELIKLGLQGVTVIAATGDDGVAGPSQFFNEDKYCGYTPLFPASSPYVTAVGGTKGLEKTIWEEIAWEYSGGGFSNVFKAPDWQRSALNSYFDNLAIANKQQPRGGYNKVGRGYPDVSLQATNYPVVVGGHWYLLSGTSAAAPVVAAMISLVNSELLSQGMNPVGLINPLLYYSGGSFANDMNVGNNSCTRKFCCSEGFEVNRGWDPVSGFGSVDFFKLRNLLITAGNLHHVNRSSTDTSVTDDRYMWRMISIPAVRLLVGLLALIALIGFLFTRRKRKYNLIGDTPGVEVGKDWLCQRQIHFPHQLSPHMHLNICTVEEAVSINAEDATRKPSYAQKL